MRTLSIITLLTMYCLAYGQFEYITLPVPPSNQIPYSRLSFSCSTTNGNYYYIDMYNYDEYMLQEWNSNTKQTTYSSLNGLKGQTVQAERINGDVQFEQFTCVGNSVYLHLMFQRNEGPITNQMYVLRDGGKNSDGSGSNGVLPVLGFLLSLVACAGVYWLYKKKFNQSTSGNGANVELGYVRA